MTDPESNEPESRRWSIIYGKPPTEVIEKKQKNEQNAHSRHVDDSSEKDKLVFEHDSIRI